MSSVRQNRQTQPAESVSFNPYKVWLSIPLENQPPNNYKLLGLQDFENDPDTIESAADRQMAHVRTFQAGKHSEASQSLLNELATARLTLLNIEKKSAYDAKLHSQLEVTGAAISETRVSTGERVSHRMNPNSVPLPATVQPPVSAPPRKRWSVNDSHTPVTPPPVAQKNTTAPIITVSRNEENGHSSIGERFTRQNSYSNKVVIGGIAGTTAAVFLIVSVSFLAGRKGNTKKPDIDNKPKTPVVTNLTPEEKEGTAHVIPLPEVEPFPPPKSTHPNGRQKEIASTQFKKTLYEKTNAIRDQHRAISMDNLLEIAKKEDDQLQKTALHVLALERAALTGDIENVNAIISMMSGEHMDILDLLQIKEQCIKHVPNEDIQKISPEKRMNILNDLYETMWQAAQEGDLPLAKRIRIIALKRYIVGLRDSISAKTPNEMTAKSNQITSMQNKFIKADKELSNFRR